MFKKIAIMMILSSLLSLSANADAAMMAYLTLKGQKSGPVKGSVTQKGREDSIGVIAFEQATMFGPGTSGRQRVGQIVITKEVDKSSPILRQMLDSQENITEAILRFWTPQIKAGTGVGSEVQFYTVRLTNARIASMKTVMDNIRYPELMKMNISEIIAFTYDRAEWIWNDGGLSATEMGGMVPPDQVK